MFSFSKNIGIDLGTANVMVYVQGEGIKINEPSVVAINAETKKPWAYGEEAKEMIGKTPHKIEVVQPLRDGVIADFDAAEMMLKYFIDKSKAKGNITRPVIIICCPTNVTTVERNAIREVAEKCGAKRVFIEEEPKVAAIGAGININAPTGSMVVDMGGGTSDIAVLSLGEIVVSSSIKIAGNKFDEDIINFMKNEFQILIGSATAERIKMTVACATPETTPKTVEAIGRDYVTGLPKTVKVNSNQINSAIINSLSILSASAKEVLEKTPPELAADIMERGIILTGGGALLEGLDTLLSENLGVPVFVAENPLDCVALGTGIMLENI